MEHEAVDGVGTPRAAAGGRSPLRSLHGWTISAWHALPPLATGQEAPAMHDRPSHGWTTGRLGGGKAGRAPLRTDTSVPNAPSPPPVSLLLALRVLEPGGGRVRHGMNYRGESLGGGGRRGHV